MLVELEVEAKRIARRAENRLPQTLLAMRLPKYLPHILLQSHLQFLHSLLHLQHKRQCQRRHRHLKSMLSKSVSFTFHKIPASLLA